MKKHKHLGKKLPSCESLKCEGGYNHNCCSCGEYSCTTAKEKHLRSVILETIELLEKQMSGKGEYSSLPFLANELIKKLKVSVGDDE